jgi:hypothetical protein
MTLLGRFIFYPETRLVGTPADVGLVYEEARFSTADGVLLHGWWVSGRRPETILWLHGNAGNISHRLDNLRLLHERVGASVLLFDYRGYGASAGTPSERGLYADAAGALAYLRGRTDVQADRIVYFGRSLGAAVAVELALHAPPPGLVLETAFTSVRGMAAEMLPSPLAALVPESFDNLARIGAVRCPILFVHGDRDEVVPYAQARRLFDAARAPKSLFTLPGAGHNDTYLVGGDRYFRRIEEFLDSLAAAAS